MKRRVLGKMAPFHTFKKKKKKQKWCRFEQHHTSSSSSGCARHGKKRTFSPAFSLLPLSLINLKETPTQHPHLLATWWKNGGDVHLGRFGAAA
jgi:hypothetical protein